MPSNSGLDLGRGRPTPAIGTTEAKLQRRKLDALKRGVHRIKDPENLAYGIHVIGVGSVGTNVLTRFLDAAPDDLLKVDGSRLSALAVDIDVDNLDAIAASGEKFPSERTHIETLNLATVPHDELSAALEKYPEYLRLEYPLVLPNPSFSSWLTEEELAAAEGEGLSRAIAKAIYGHAYYSGDRPAATALKRFAASVESAGSESIVCIVFALGDDAGSAIALDLARHLSVGLFGRRILVTGIGIAPCAGDNAEHSGAQLFATLNELDALCDENKNRGITQSCGELYKNPFTAGFIMVPQEPFWQQTGDLGATQQRVADELSALLTLRKGANLWELLRLLNWVAAPPTQHSAARSPWGAKWIHLLSAVDRASEGEPGLSKRIGVLPSYEPEFIEVRAHDSSDSSALAWVEHITNEFQPSAPINLASGGAEDSVQFLLPRLAKTDLSFFESARRAYDAASYEDRLAAHCLLREHGLVLCEPSDRFEGMAGAAIRASQQWTMVLWNELRGESEMRP